MVVSTFQFGFVLVRSAGARPTTNVAVNA